MVYLAYSSKEKTNTGWKFFNKYIKQKRKKNKAIKQRIKLVAYDYEGKE